MKTFSTVIKSCNSETLFYCVRIIDALEVLDRKIFVSTPLTFSEFKDFVEHRIAKQLQNRVKIVECYQKLTDQEQEELYGLDSFARILSAINANAKRYWDVVFYYKDTGERGNCLCDTASTIDLLKSGRVISIKPEGWKAM